MNIAVIYGGKSCEHSISVITGVQVLNAISKNHSVTPIFIDNDGVWYTGKNLSDITVYKSANLKLKKVFIKPYDTCLYNDRGRKICNIDCAVLCNHGANGEDGSLQGLLQLAGIPFTGSGVSASAVGMDKALMKKVFAVGKLPVLKCAEVKRPQFEKNFVNTFERVKKLGFPIIVKPSSAGSSIGISIAHNEQELVTSLNVAFEWDNCAIAEQALTDFTELNCAVLGDGIESITSEIEQPLSWNEFLTFSDKYEKGKIKGDDSGRKMPADIDEEMTALVKKTAVNAFNAIGASGVTRVDFLLDNKSGKLYVNEINTIPGSLSNYLFAFSDIDFESLIERLIAIAVSEQEARDRCKYKYKSGFGIKGK